MSANPETLRDNAKRFIKARTMSATIGSAFQRVFGGPDGKLVLAWLAREGRLLETTAISGDPALTHFYEGKRALLLDILRALRWSEAETMALAQERTVDQIASAMGDE